MELIRNHANYLIKKIKYEADNEVIRLCEMSCDTQKLIGTIAKHKKVHWFKRIDLGEAMGAAIFNNLDMIDTTRALYRVIGNLYHWVIRND